MTPYFVIFSILFFFALMEGLGAGNMTKRIFLLIAGIILVFFAGFRYDNPDWRSYIYIFNNIAERRAGLVDVGFQILCRAIFLISKSPVFVFTIIALLSVSINLKSFKKYSPYFLTCVLFYFVHMYVLKDMIQIRSGLASAIGLYSIRFLYDNKKVYFVLGVLCASSIHISSIVLLLILLMNQFSPGRKFLGITLAISLLIGLMYPLGGVVERLSVLFGVDNRVGYYIDYTKYDYKLGILANANTIKCVLFSIIFLVYYKKLSVAFPYFRLLLYSYIIGTCWLLVFNDFAIVAARVSSILLTVEPIMVSFLAILFKPQKQWMYSIGIALLALIMLVTNMVPDKVEPYQFYFNHIQLY